MGEKDGTQQQLASNRFKLAYKAVQCVDMADMDLILHELRGFRKKIKNN